MLNSSVNREDILGNGVTTVFSFPFEIFSTADLTVFATVVATGVSTVLAAGTDYTVPTAAMLNNPSGGSITPLAGGPASLTIPIPTGTTINIIRTRSLLQNVDYKNQGVFYPENHEASYDNCAMVDQYLFMLTQQSVRAPLAEAPGTYNYTLPPAVERALGFISFDINGNLVVTPYPSISIVASAASLPATPPGPMFAVTMDLGVLYFYNPYDGNGWEKVGLSFP